MRFPKIPGVIFGDTSSEDTVKVHFNKYGDDDYVYNRII